MASQRPHRQAAPTMEQLRENRLRQTEQINPAEQPDDPADSGSEEEDEIFNIDVENSDQDDEIDHEQGQNRQVPFQPAQGSYFGQSGDHMEWSAIAPQLRGRRGAQDVVRHAEGPVGTARNARTATETFHLFVSNDILETVVRHTNEFATMCLEANGGWLNNYWTPIDVEELNAFIACLIFAGVSKSGNESVEQLWSTEFGRPFVRACMSLQRFTMIMRFLRFDDRTTRIERRERDKFAPIREIWEIFMQHCRQYYQPGQYCTVDEQLVGFRGRCPFRVYMPDKPDKYGIKIWWLCNSDKCYAYNGQVYLGRVGNVPEVGLGSRVVQDLSRPIFNTGRNLTMDSFFTSVPLANDLYNNGLTLVGTLRSNKPQIPVAFLKDRRRPLYSSLFGFTNKMTLCSYVGRKGKAVLLLSSMHHGNAVSGDREDRKPEIITFYNSTKGAVDILDQCVHAYTSSRATNRWPNKIFFNMIDVGSLNGFVIFEKNNPNWNENKLFKRRLYLLELAKELAASHMDRRAQVPQLQIPVRQVLQQQGFQNRNQARQADEAARDRGLDRSRCHLCPQRNVVRVRCRGCGRFVCKDHSVKAVSCNNCVQ